MMHSKAADVLKKIQKSELAVIQTGLIQANFPLLSSSTLQTDCANELLGLLLCEPTSVLVQVLVKMYCAVLFINFFCCTF